MNELHHVIMMSYCWSRGAVPSPPYKDVIISSEQFLTESYTDISWTGVRLLYDLCIVFVSVYCYCVFAISVHDSQRRACYSYYRSKS